MSNIVLQICEKFISEVMGVFGDRQIRTIEEIETGLKAKTNDFILGMMKTYLECVDQALVDDKSNRREKGIVIERRAKANK